MVALSLSNRLVGTSHPNHVDELLSSFRRDETHTSSRTRLLSCAPM
jgi:hypothetical protein